MNCFLAGFIWSVLWILYIFMILKFFPWELLHDYPEDIQQASALPFPTSRQKKSAKLSCTVFSIVIFLVLALFAITRFSASSVSFWSILSYEFIIAMFWNVTDLLIMDWLIICLITPKIVVIPGSEGCKGYKDYLFHFKGFLTGCLYSILIAFLFSGIVFGILKFFIWK